MSKFIGNNSNLDLPEGVLESDKDYATEATRLDYNTKAGLGIQDVYELTFYKTKSFGWILCTLAIKKAVRADRSARSYAIGVKDGKQYRAGNGPHVIREFTAIIKKDNVDRLMPFIELLRKGEEDSQAIRDRISSRRAQGQLNRARGITSWQW